MVQAAFRSRQTGRLLEESSVVIELGVRASKLKMLLSYCSFVVHGSTRDYNVIYNKWEEKILGYESDVTEGSMFPNVVQD